MAGCARGRDPLNRGSIKPASRPIARVGRRSPRALPIRVRIVRYSGRMLTEGVTSRTVQGVSLRITDPARTVVDCFRYRNKFGLDVALEALRDALRTKKASVAQLERVAEVCRIRTVMKPYVEALM